MPNSAPDPLTPEVKNTVLQLLRSALWGTERFPFHPDPGTDWEAVYTELCHQTVQHIPVDLLVAADPARAMQYIQNAARNIQKWHRLMQQQQTICAALAQAGISCAVVKGAAAGFYYPKPDHRCMGDIDLIVPPADYHHALKLFQSDWKFLSENERHAELRKDKLTLELHQKFSTFRSPELCQFLDDMIYPDIPLGNSRTIENYAFPVLPRKTAGLVFLTHINVHMERGLGLRQMLDWMMFANREMDDAFWETEFRPAAQALGLEKLAVTVTRMCQLHLGLRDDLTWCRNAEEDLCNQLLDHTFRQGNFGRKVPHGVNQAVGIFSTSRNLPKLLMEMQHLGITTWPAVKKYPFLRPFAWLRQILHYLRLLLQKEHPLRYFVNAFRTEKTQGSLLDRLEVSRMNNDL